MCCNSMREENVQQNFPQSRQILSGSKFADFNGRGRIEEGGGGFKLLTRCDLAFHSNLHTCTKLLVSLLLLHTLALLHNNYTRSLQTWGTHEKVLCDRSTIHFADFKFNYYCNNTSISSLGRSFEPAQVPG